MQLVMYPILNLNRHTQDLHWYLRVLEEVVIRALADTSGLQGERVPGMTGVWVDGQKLAAIGVRARKWVTYHGLALNVSTGGPGWGARRKCAEVVVCLCYAAYVVCPPPPPLQVGCSSLAEVNPYTSDIFARLVPVAHGFV
jgi:hypothetical protein